MVENIIWFFTNLIVDVDGFSAYKLVLTQTCYFDTLQKIAFSSPEFLKSLDNFNLTKMCEIITWSVKIICLDTKELRTINEEAFENII